MAPVAAVLLMHMTAEVRDVILPYWMLKVIFEDLLAYDKHCQQLSRLSGSNSVNKMEQHVEEGKPNGFISRNFEVHGQSLVLIEGLLQL